MSKAGKEDTRFRFRLAIRQGPLPDGFFAEFATGLQVIEQFHKDLTAEVVVLHIQDTRVLEPHLQEKLEEFNQIETERLSAIKDRLTSLEYRVRTILKTGKSFREINAIAEGENVSLIVIGSHGKSNVREAYTGSETEFITLQHVRPVMVIPRDRDVE